MQWSTDYNFETYNSKINTSQTSKNPINYSTPFFLHRQTSSFFWVASLVCRKLRRKPGLSTRRSLHWRLTLWSASSSLPPPRRCSSAEAGKPGSADGQHLGRGEGRLGRPWGQWCRCSSCWTGNRGSSFFRLKYFF